MGMEMAGGDASEWRGEATLVGKGGFEFYKDKQWIIIGQQGRGTILGLCG